MAACLHTLSCSFGRCGRRQWWVTELFLSRSSSSSPRKASRRYAGWGGGTPLYEFLRCRAHGRAARCTFLSLAPCSLRIPSEYKVNFRKGAKNRCHPLIFTSFGSILVGGGHFTFPISLWRQFLPRRHTELGVDLWQPKSGRNRFFASGRIRARQYPYDRSI